MMAKIKMQLETEYRRGGKAMLTLAAILVHLSGLLAQRAVKVSVQ